MTHNLMTSHHLEKVMEDVENFEMENPKIVEAMRLFDISMEEYRVALRYLDSKLNTTTSAGSTNPEDHNADLA